MDFITDLNAYLKVGNSKATEAKNSTNKKAGTDMDMTDYLKLMVATFQNQSIDDVASTSDMMNQMVQMSVIQAVTSLNKMVSESSSMTYAASLVGKEVTIGQRDGDRVSQLVGKVTGTGVLDGEQVIFIGDHMYNISDVIAVGRVPSSVDTSELGSLSGDTAFSESETVGNSRDGDVFSSVSDDNSYSGSGAVDTSGFDYIQDESGVIRIVYRGEDGEYSTGNGPSLNIAPGTGAADAASQAAASNGVNTSAEKPSESSAADNTENTERVNAAEGAENGNAAAAEEEAKKD